MNARTSTYPPLIDSRGALDLDAFLRELDALTDDRPASRPYWTRILLLEVAEQQWPFMQPFMQWTEEEGSAWEQASDFAYRQQSVGNDKTADYYRAEAHRIYLGVRNRAQAAFYASLKEKESEHV